MTALGHTGEVGQVADGPAPADSTSADVSHSESFVAA